MEEVHKYGTKQKLQTALRVSALIYIITFKCKRNVDSKENQIH